MNKALKKLKGLKRKDIATSHIVNVWLREFFDTTIEEVEKDYTKNDDGTYDAKQSRKFYITHKVTQEQHDWWEKEIKKVFRKFHSKKYVDRHWWSVHLDTSPSIIRKEEL